MVINIKYKKYFIRQYSFEKYPHGGIGYTDAETILEKEGFQPITFPCHNQFSAKAKLIRLFFLLKTIFSANGPAIMVFIFPAYAGMVKLFLRLLSWKPGVRIVCFIGDIDGIKDGNKEKLKTEIRELQRYRYFIVHNDAMKEWLQQHVEKSNCAVLEFFDFLATPLNKTRPLSPDIVFAGNLEKRKFLESLHLLLNKASSKIHFNLYGPGYTESMALQKKVYWFGIEKPYNLPAKINGSFGLVWDSDSVDEPVGSLGDYMQYISHHKLSLYILSGLPVIVPATAGSAALVEKYKIGITIKSLYEIENKIKSITNEEYQQMQKNMQPLAEKISTGGCIKEALQKLMPLI